MGLPTFRDAVETVTVPVGAADVTFQIVPIAAARLADIRAAHADDEGRVLHDDIRRDVIEAGTIAVYSSIESTPTPLTGDDLDEIETGWPEWARTAVYEAVFRLSTRGPAADPKDG